MIAALNDDNHLASSFVNQPVLAIDAAGPITGPIVPQGFGIAEAFMRVALNVFYQGVYAF